MTKRKGWRTFLGTPSERKEKLEPGPWVRHMSLVVAQTILNSIIWLLKPCSPSRRAVRGKRGFSLQLGGTGGPPAAALTTSPCQYAWEWRGLSVFLTERNLKSFAFMKKKQTMNVAFRVCFAGSHARGIAYPWDRGAPASSFPEGYPQPFGSKPP